MPVKSRVRNRLNGRKVAALTEPGYHADGGGLYLQISKARTKSWIFRFTLNKRTREMGLGSLSVVSLAQAREHADHNRQLLAKRLDPIDHRDTEHSARAAARAARKTFKECAEAYVAAHEVGWKNVKHAEQWRNTLATYAYPVCGQVSVGDVSVAHVTQILDPIWKVKTETASRLRGRIERVLDWATVRKYRAGDNPARWRGHLDALLPKRSSVQRVRHHEALPYEEVGRFVAELRGSPGIAALALEFVVLTVVRVSEAMKAKWNEFELNSAVPVWTIRAERMKSYREHRVPLTPRVVKILRKLWALSADDTYVFLSPMKMGQPLSDASLLSLAKQLGGPKLTTHGFRSTFRDWAAECTNYAREVADSALAHVVADRVEAAYRRGDLFEKRRRMMSDWERYCGTVRNKSSNVVKLRTRSTF